MTNLHVFLQEVCAAIEARFTAVSPPIEVPYKPVIDAMRYSFLAGGKRVRPALVVAWCDAFGGARDHAFMTGLAFECLHTYSLIHDDLPCMDDDILRRGQPTCHVQFDECTATLAGDGLQALAFDVLARLDIKAETQVKLIHLLAHAAGAQGMVGGQMWDMLSEQAVSHNTPPALTLDDLRQLQAMKTGALIESSCVAGALIAGEDSAIAADYGKALGALFQITDDILDVEGGADIGKTAGKDAAAGKVTFVSALGLDGAKNEADQLLETCLTAVHSVDNAAILRELAHYVRVRQK